jgi:hypothetical protein
VIDINEQTQKLEFFRDEAEMSRAAGAIEAVQAMQANGDNRIAA